MAIYKVLFEKLYTILTLLMMGLFFSRLLTYPAMMTLATVVPYSKKIQKHLNT